MDNAEGHAIRPYLNLMQALVEKRLTPAEFESIFLSMYKNDPTEWQSYFGLLENLFANVDGYVEDEALRTAVNGMSGTQLREAVEPTLRLIEKSLGE